MNNDFETLQCPPWQKEDLPLPQYPALSSDLSTDIVIVGGGLSGIACAYYLSQKGINTVVLESGTIGQGASGNNTGHLTAHHGAVFTRYINYYNQQRAALILSANLQALTDIKEIIDTESIDCDYTPMPYYLTADTKTGINKLIKESSALQSLGEQCELSYKQHADSNKTATLTIPSAKTATFNPVKYLYGLAQAAANRKAKIFQQSKVLKVAHDLRSCTVNANGYTVTAKYCVIATHMPFINFPGLYVMRAYSQRAYAAYYPLSSVKKDSNDFYNLESAMSYDIDDGGYTFGAYKDGYIICGQDHRTGTAGRKPEKFTAIQDYTAKQLGNSMPPTNVWATQDVMTGDFLPYIGAYAKSMPNCLVVTGFNGWGLNSSHLAAKIIADTVDGTLNPLIKVYSPQRRTPIISKLKVAGNISTMLLHYAKGLFKVKNPVCTHLKCRLQYNHDLNTWDCPCHGSVFDQKGKVVETPALKDIKD